MIFRLQAATAAAGSAVCAVAVRLQAEASIATPVTVIPLLEKNAVMSLSDIERPNGPMEILGMDHPNEVECVRSYRISHPAPHPAATQT